MFYIQDVEVYQIDYAIYWWVTGQSKGGKEAMLEGNQWVLVWSTSRHNMGSLWCALM